MTASTERVLVDSRRRYGAVRDAAVFPLGTSFRRDSVTVFKGYRRAILMSGCQNTRHENPTNLHLPEFSRHAASKFALSRSDSVSRSKGSRTQKNSPPTSALPQLFTTFTHGTNPWSECASHPNSFTVRIERINARFNDPLEYQLLGSLHHFVDRSL